MAQEEFTSVPVKRETLELVRSKKRGGISYDTLIQEMAADYDPQENAGGQ